MAVIHMITLSPEVANGIMSRKYSEAQLGQMYDSYISINKKRKQGLLIAMILVAVMMIGYGVPVFVIKIGLPEALPLIIMIFVIVGIVWFLTWYLTLESVKLKWNSLIKEYYPLCYEKYKL